MRILFEHNNLKLIANKIDKIDAFAPMIHSHMEIIYILSGELRICIDAMEKTMHSGEYCITFPYSIHSNFASPHLNALILLVDPALFNDFSNTLFSSRLECPFFSGNMLIQTLINCIIEYSKNDDSISNATVKGYLGALLGEILKNARLIKIIQSKRNSIQNILAYCSNNFQHNISIKSMSKDLFIHQRQITNIFSAYLHTSFRNYINLLRVNHAVSLLEHTNMKITEILYECGFENQSTFNRIFYKTMSVTPSEYRKNYKNHHNNH